jgi:N-6 DNA Methylase/TaqI-like C-terminal specificity domain
MLQVCMQGDLKERPGWYEATLSLAERRRRGHFSTPPLLVERMLDACGYTSAADLKAVRVLDPACGSGNFLAGAARRLVDYGARAHLGATELAALLWENIRGFDPDPVSCFLSEMQVSSIAPLPAPMPWRIQQADGLALPWDAQACIDLYLANPPYLAAKNTDLSGYRAAQQRGQADSYLLFLNLGLQVVRPHGWLALVLPDPVLARSNAAPERARLLAECTIHHIWHLAGVFSAQVGAVVIIAQKCRPRVTHQVSWVRAKWGPASARASFPHSDPPPQVSQALLMRQPASELRYLLGSAQAVGIERLQTVLREDSPQRHAFAPLGEFLLLRRGEELGCKSPLLRRAGSEGPEGAPEEWFPVLRGGRDMRPFATDSGGWWLARTAIVKPLERYQAPKLLVVKSTDRLQAALDIRGHVALQTLYMLSSRERERERERERQAGMDDLYFFLALLNSRLLGQYVRMLFTAYKWVQPQIEQRVLASLPVPRGACAAKQSISGGARRLASACDEPGPVVEWRQELISRLYEEQERAICALYAAAFAETHDEGVAGYD